MTSTIYIQEIKLSKRNFTLSLGDQAKSQSPLRNVKKLTACTNAMVSTRLELAADALTTTTIKEKEETSATYV